MCGISGIIDKKNRPVDTSIIKKMNDLIAHRGPDDEGCYDGDNFALGHRRLSILDLSNAGHQPMIYQNRFVITYNGEIYNYLEIREELEKLKYHFETHTDTEVILASYAEWGIDCVKRFNGMWAFAIFDKEKNIIFCSRDRFGVKPFYYSDIDGKFVFSSEIKQLLELHHKRYVNSEILLDYLLYGLEEHTDETFFRDVKKLPQSHNMIYDLNEHTFTIERYYNLSVDRRLEELSEDESVSLVRNALDRSIELRLRSDVKVGTCLSGGLDSSSIAAIAAKKYVEQSGERFGAVHAKSIEEKTDESEYAEAVAKYCGLNLIIIEPQLKDLTEAVEEVVYTQEEPFGGPSIFMQYFVMQTARKHGCTVMLDGQGGDETLFGYEGYFPFYFASLLRGLRLKKYIKELKELETFKVPKRNIVRNSIILLLRSWLSPLESAYRKRRYPIKIPYQNDRLKKLFEMMDFKKFQIREITIQNLPHLLRYEDKNSMRHSVETRLPFVDYNFVRTAVSIRDDLKFKDGFLKYILRRSVEDLLPRSVVWRKNKFGFEAPTDLWIDEYRDEMMKKISESSILNNIINISKINFRNNSVLWRLFNIAVWEEVYRVQIE